MKVGICDVGQVKQNEETGLQPMEYTGIYIDGYECRAVYIYVGWYR